MADLQGQRPNILWICTDQQRYDTVGALGHAHVHTPNLDRLCEAGTAFTHCYCQSPICTPSRASFLTGLYPSAVHANRNGAAYFGANERVRLITSRLAEAGYDCGLAGKLHLCSAWQGVEPRVEDGYRVFHYSNSPSQGYRRGNAYLEWLEAQGVDPATLFDAPPDTSPRQAGRSYRPDAPTHLHQTAWCAEKAIEFLRQPRSGQPWLMSVNIFDPHPPFDAPDAWAARYDPDRLARPLYRESDLAVQQRLGDFYFQAAPEPPGERHQRMRARYYGMVSLIDEQVGRMLDALDATGQRDNTVVIFTSDHGEMLGDHGLQAKGCRFYEPLVRVPLILAWPGRFAAGRRHEGLVELTDLAPTLAELADVPLPWTHGQSLLGVLDADMSSPRPVRDYVRCEYYDTLNMFAPHEPHRHRSCWATMLRDERHKLVVYHGCEYGELYDLQAGPNEFDNLWDTPSAREVRDRMIRRSFDLTVQSQDPGPALIGRF